MVATDSICLEFLRSTGEPLKFIDLGADFLRDHNIPAQSYSSQFKISMVPKDSKAGNVYYDFSQSAIPFPDGLATWIRLDGTVIPMGKIRPSKSGHPTREGAANILIGGILYDVTAFLTESKSPFYIKIIAHKVPDRSANIKKAQAAPKGGHFVF
jgi:hypothetical protein